LRSLVRLLPIAKHLPRRTYPMLIRLAAADGTYNDEHDKHALSIPHHYSNILSASDALPTTKDCQIIFLHSAFALAHTELIPFLSTILVFIP